MAAMGCLEVAANGSGSGSDCCALSGVRISALGAFSDALTGEEVKDGR